MVVIKMSAPPNVAVSTSISSSGSGMGGFIPNGHQNHPHQNQQIIHHQPTHPIAPPQSPLNCVPPPQIPNHMATGHGHPPVHQPPRSPNIAGHPLPPQPSINHGPGIKVSFPLSREKARRFREIAESDHKLISDLQKFGIHSICFQGSNNNSSLKNNNLLEKVE